MDNIFISQENLLYNQNDSFDGENKISNSEQSVASNGNETKEDKKETKEDTYEIPQNYVKSDNTYSSASGYSYKNIGEKFNINKVTFDELCTIKGIGSSTAEKILSRRKEIGGFKTIEDLKEISGIGEKRFLTLREYLYI